MKRRKASTLILAVLLSLVLSVPAYAAVYKRTDERYPQGEFMIILESKGNGAYALGVDGAEWILKPLYDISAVGNDDLRYLFRFESSERNQKWADDQDMWNRNHSMAILSSGGYLGFDSTGVEFLASKPIVSAAPVYHWQYMDRGNSGKGNYLKFKGSYETAGLAGALWVKANAERDVIMLTTAGKGSDTYLYQAVEGAEAAAAGGWQSYTNGYQYNSWKYINPDGSLKQNEWYEENGKKYYFGSDGVALLGMNHLPDGNDYYFLSDASLLVNSEVSLSQTPYRMGSDGVCHGVLDSDMTRSPITTPQYDRDDDLINWINFKRSANGLAPLYRDNRLAAIAEDITKTTDGIVDWQTLDDMGLARGITFTKRFNLRMNWNEDMKNLTLEHYYTTGDLKTIADDPELQYIGVFTQEMLAGYTKDAVIVVGRYK